MTEEFKSVYARMVEARERHEQTNGRIIKPFKAQYGDKELFHNNELVSVTCTDIEAVEPVFIVTGASYDHKKNTFTMKSALLSEENLSKYVKMTGEVVTLGPAKTHTFQTKFISKSKFKSLNEIEIPKGTYITKTTQVRGGGLLSEKIEAQGYPDAIVDNEKLGYFCTVTEPRVEIATEESE